MGRKPQPKQQLRARRKQYTATKATTHLMPEQQRQDNVKERTGLREPHKWAVIAWNDDFTTMDFVVKVLMSVFMKSQPEAEKIMMQVHKEGQSVVGTYSYDIAVSRARIAMDMARKEGFPLKLTYKEV